MKITNVENSEDKNEFCRVFMSLILTIYYLRNKMRDSVCLGKINKVKCVNANSS